MVYSNLNLDMWMDHISSLLGEGQQAYRTHVHIQKSLSRLNFRTRRAIHTHTKKIEYSINIINKYKFIAGVILIYTTHWDPRCCYRAHALY